MLVVAVEVFIHLQTGGGGGSGGGIPGGGIVVEMEIMQHLQQVVVVVVVLIVECGGCMDKGGSGIVIVRYQIGTVQLQMQKQLVVLLVSMVVKLFTPLNFW